MAFEQENTHPIWPPTGVALAAMLYFGLRVWPAIFLGAFLLILQVSSSPVLSLSIAFGNTLEALLASFIILHFANKTPFSKISHTAIFIVALFIASILSAAIGVGSLVFTNFISIDKISFVWKTWWIGNFVGGLVLVPFILTWIKLPKETLTHKRMLEAVLLVFVTLTALYTAFGSFKTIGITDEFISFSLLPLLAWSVLRFHHHGASLMMIIISIASIYGTLNGYGPFILETENHSLLALQAYIGAAMFTALLLMAAQEERLSAYRVLRHNEQNLESTISAKTKELQDTNCLLEEEIHRQTHLSDSLKTLLRNVGSSSKEDFFTRCTETLSAIYKTQYAFIGIFDDKQNRTIKTLAVWNDGKPAENLSYRLDGTPCDDILNFSMEYISHGASKRYPNNVVLNSMGIESYYSAPLKSSSGKVIGIMAVMDQHTIKVDSTISSLLALLSGRVGLELQRRYAFEELELAECVFKESMEAIIICDAEAKIIRTNPEFTKITGYTQAEALGQKPKLLKSHQHDQKFYEKLWSTLDKQGFWEGEIINKRKNGEIFISWQIIKAVKDDHGVIQQYISIINDITEKKQAQEQIYSLAHHDPITQLPNRAYFLKILQEAIDNAALSSTRLAVMFIDLDHFKLINDTSGHPAGDELLQQVAARLKDAIGSDNVISRFGGDEFTVLLPCIETLEEASDVATGILDSLQSPFSLLRCEITMSASIGISIYPDNSRDASLLVSYADSAMYRAKESGRANFEFYTDQMKVEAQERVILERELRYALKAGEFILHYQPQIDISNRRVLGIEALIRWQHPVRGLVPPNVFIPIAEATGLIVPMGEWVIQEACRQLASWRQMGYNSLTMAVNLSARQFFQKNLLDTIKSALESSGIPADKLVFEITESMMMKNIEETINTLHQMKNLGLQLSIDDFGTGYSSLSYLKRFPIDKLKIDKSFVDGLPKDIDDIAIVEAIIAIARALKLTVIAEGVETEDQYDLLSKYHCNQIQGFIFSKPLVPEEIYKTFHQS